MASKRKAATTATSSRKAKRIKDSQMKEPEKVSTSQALSKKVPVKAKPIKATTSRRTRSSKPISLPFFELPLELRERIYMEYFASDHLPPNCHRGCLPDCNLHTGGFAALLLVSRQFHNEVWPYYAAHRSFVFSSPMYMANNFLSFLPRQRLLNLKHLILQFDGSGMDWSDFMAELQRAWWYYLDVFARLETLTVEYIQTSRLNFGEIDSFYELVQPLIGLLEQGCPKKAKSVCPGKSGLLPIHANDLPVSHDWVMQIGAMSKTDKGSPGRINNITSHRIVIRRHVGTESQQHRDLFGKWTTWVEGHRRPTGKKTESIVWPELYELRGGTPIGLNSSMRLYYQRFHGSQNWISYYFGPDTKLLPSPETSLPSSGNPGFRAAYLVRIGGRWHNVHDLL